MNSLKIVLAQVNVTVGDLSGNLRRIIKALQDARKTRAGLVVFPELALTGYPPEDLLLKKKFVEDNLVCLEKIQEATTGLSAVVGFADPVRNGFPSHGISNGADRDGKGIYNAAAYFQDGKISGIIHKMCLPNYGVFDEKRYFLPGKNTQVFNLFGIPAGISICEDIWENEGPLKKQAELGAKLFINISASPYHRGKKTERENLLKKRAQEHGIPLVYVNLVGGQDELVFDGGSQAWDLAGNLQAQSPFFKEALSVLEFHPETQTMGGNIIPPPEDSQEVYEALVLGTRDYCHKNGFKKAVLGLSGGIDSSLTACIAVDALGKSNVTGVMMPSMFTSRESKEDAKILAKNLELKHHEFPVAPVFFAYKKLLMRTVKKRKISVPLENLQARIRGNILMALSNEKGWLVLTTGNKSEMSAGYATLYGDMAGGFAVIKDVPKTLVYKLSRFRNKQKKVIPERVFTKPPTAELRKNQKDTDSLPPYEILDPILHAYVEEDKSMDDIRKCGYNETLIKKVMSMVDRNEYKRRQAPPGVKITPKAFGRDRRMPITNRYR